MKNRFRRSKRLKKGLSKRQDITRIAQRYGIPFGRIRKERIATYDRPFGWIFKLDIPTKPEKNKGEIQGIIDAVFRQMEEAENSIIRKIQNNENRI